jgi:hypothetical protein
MVGPMQVVCPQCDKPLPSSAINIERLLGKCDDCNLLFDCSDQLQPAPSKRPSQRRRPPVPLPPGLTLDVSRQLPAPLPDAYRSEVAKMGGTVVIRRHWRTTASALVFRALFAVCWWSFLVFWYTLALGMNAGWLFVVFPLIHVAAGVWMVYSLLADMLNTTTITADGSALTVRHLPLPMSRAISLPAATITQIFCKQVERATKKNRSPLITYSVCACLDDGRQLPLLERLPNPDQALFIEQQLESHLGIIDAPVGGEMDEE